MASFVPLFGCLVIEREKVGHLVQFQDMVKAQRKKYPDFAQQVLYTIVPSIISSTYCSSIGIIIIGLI